MAELAKRPFPPGEYPVVVVGSGPGGLQTSYSLSRRGVDHAVISADDSPGGMFRFFPIYQRLLSWTKPDAPCEPGTREYEWYDHNSLVGDVADCQALVSRFMDRTYMVPSRAEMEQGMVAFAERAGVHVRYGCRWEGTRREDDGTLVLSTTDGEYRCKVAVFAIGVTTPWKSPIAGIEHVPHYAEAKAPQEYKGRRVFVIGKRNSGFEVADGLLPWASQIILGSPRPVQTAVLAQSSIRVRYLQPLEDHALGGGTLALDAAIERIERRDGGFRIVAEGTTRPGRLELDVDDVIAATGFSAPLLDLPDLGVATVAQGRIPALTPFWESEPGSGIFFAGNATQGAAGLRKHGVGSSSPAVHGFRYNAKVMARYIAERLGMPLERERVDRDELGAYLAWELTWSPELWAQKAYLARVVGPEGEAEILPLAHWLDHAEETSVAATIELNDKGEIYPVVYAARRGGEVAEHVLEPALLQNYTADEYRRRLDQLA